MDVIAAKVLEVVYILVGIQLVHTAWVVFKEKEHPHRLGTCLFWGLLGIIFLAGTYIPPLVTGIMVIVMAGLTLTKQVSAGPLPKLDELRAEEKANYLKNTIFLPVVVLAVSALGIAQLFPAFSRSALGIGAVLATLVALFVTKEKPSALLSENHRMIRAVGTSGILPQLLGALGAVFTTAGVGEVIASIIEGAVPEGNRLAGVIAYVLGMVIFTMIMGNAFAAFTVITTGVGMPFVIAAGANPFIAGALAMTAGYCGTLLTPMAANFNAVPAALMDMKDANGVIKAQAPVALVMILVHIVLMYLWAF